MSRVFVSCANRDRAVGDRVVDLLRTLGDEPVDDCDDTRGIAWWNEVVGRIETCDTFVAVVSPAYADAHACRLAAKHAAATGLPVVRLDLADRAPTSGLHPIVKMARPVRFDPDDPGAPAVLERAIDQALSPEPPAASPRQEARPAPPPGPPPPVRPGGGNQEQGRFSGLKPALAVFLVVAALVLLVVEGRAVSQVWQTRYEVVTLSSEARDDDGAAHGVTTSTGQTSGDHSSAAPSGPAASPSGTPDAQQLLSTIGAVGSDRLRASSCAVGENHVTCRDPAPNIGTVVLTPYSSVSELYAAYGDQVETLSGEPLVENTGNCSTSESEGEIGWNLDKEHTLAFSVAEQEGGGLDPASESAGRVFCTDTQQVMTLVWTQDPGLLVTVTGQPSELVVDWWSDVHLELACASGEEGRGCA